MFIKLFQLDRWLLFVAISGSLLVSLWANIVNDIINNDGIEYVKSARAILQGEWLLAMQTFKWPFYSAIMAFISTLTGLSLENSAYLFNALCYVWLVVAFVSLVRVLGGSRTTLWFAVLIILAFPAMNKFRPYLIRDPAFYALFLSGCYAFFVYIKYRQTRYNIIAIACFVIGALFRVESVIYLFVTQAYLLGQHFFYRCNRMLSLLAVLALFLSVIVLVSWWQFSPTDEMSYLSIFSHPVQFMETVWLQVLEQFGIRLNAIESKVLVGYSKGYSVVVLMWSALTIVFFELVHALYYIYFFLWFVAWRKGILFPEKALYRPWRYLVFVALLILVGFVAIQWFLSNRYPITAALLLLLTTPFLMTHWFEQLKRGGQKRVFYTVLILIVLSGIKSFDLYTQKGYLKQAGVWMSENIPADRSVYTNSRILAYYFGREAKTDPYWPYWEPFKVAGLLARQHFDFAAIEIHHNNPGYIDKLPHLLGAKIIGQFINEKGSRVYVFDFGQRLQSDWPKLGTFE